MTIEKIKQRLRPYYVPLAEHLLFRYSQRKNRLHIMGALETIRYIKKHGCSMSRFGDGEYHLMMNSIDIGFQNSSKALQQDLRDVMSSDNDNLLICLPACVQTTVGMKPAAASFWYGFAVNNYLDLYTVICDCGKKHYCFGDAMLTRPYMDWKSRWKSSIKFKALKSLWNNKRLLIVEGEQTRLGVGNDLFGNAASIKRILAPAQHAYDQYSKIRETVLSNYSGELILLALGPTATVLAADLAKMGIQALDVGHVDIEYMWYLMKTTEKIPIAQKYVNEVAQQQTEQCHDAEYCSQVIANLAK